MKVSDPSCFAAMAFMTRITAGPAAPTASYAQNWHFVVVTDPQRRATLGKLGRSAGVPYLERRAAAAAADQRVARISDAVRYLAEHIHEVPVHVIPCVEGRTDHAPVVAQASRSGSIIPGAWSFMLAARARSLGTVWTPFHLRQEREAADVLGIPFQSVMQAAPILVAYTVGTDFRPAARAGRWTRWFTASGGRTQDPATSRQPGRF
jgi:nitroreductase